MVIIGASQALDPGSIPGERSLRNFWRGISSIGRVRALQARGTGIETPMLQLMFFFSFYSLFDARVYANGTHAVGRHRLWIRSGSSVGRAWV